MLRRKSADAFEFRMVETALATRAPAPLSDERKIVLLNRVMQSLGKQQLTTGERLGVLVQTKWVAVPAGAGLAAALAVAVAGQLNVTGGSPGNRASLVGDLWFEGSGGRIDSGELVMASAHSWIAYGNEVQVGLEQGSAMRFRSDSEGVYVDLVSGDGTFSTTGRPISVYGGDWEARLDTGGVARFSMTNGLLSVEAFGGEVEVTANGTTYRIAPGAGPFTIPSGAAGPVGLQDVPSPAPLLEARGPEAVGPGTRPGNAPSQSAAPETAPGIQPPGEGDGAVPAGGNGAAGGNPPANPPEPQGNANGHDTAPGQGGANAKPPDPGSGNNGQPRGGSAGETRPEEPGPAGPGTTPAGPGQGSGNGTPPENPGNPPGNGNGAPPENPGNGSGNGAPPENPGNGSGNGTPPGNQGKSSGNGNGNSGGNGNGNGNS